MLSHPVGVSLYKDELFIFHNGKTSVIKSPLLNMVLPAEWQGTKIGKNEFTPNHPITRMEEQYYFIGKNRFKISDPTTKAINEWAPAVSVPVTHEQWRNGVGSRLPFSYTDYMLLTKSDMLSNYSNTDDIKILHFDIEVASDGTGLFPKAHRNAIAMIGYQLDDGPIEIIDCYDAKAKGMEDHEILIAFSKMLKELNPDILASYNGWRFDMPYILERMKMRNIPMYSLLGISEEECAVYPSLRTYCIKNSDPENEFQLGTFGRRVHYDIYHVDVMRDQKLTGKVKDKKMKTVASYFYPDAKDIILLEDSGMENIAGLMQSTTGKSELKEYLNSDIVQTKRLTDAYFDNNNIQQAEKLGVPLSTIVNRRNGTIPTIYLLRELFDNNMMPLSQNIMTFDDLIRRSEEMGEKKFFQGAYVAAMKHGKIPRPIYKIDFSSLYPNIIRTFNLSYETVQAEYELLREEDLSPDNRTRYEGEQLVRGIPDHLDTYSAKRGDVNGTDSLIITFNDKILHCKVKITIDMTKRGLMPRVLDKVLNERKNTRAKMKDMDTHSIEYKKLDSEQNFYKVVANSVLDFEEVICYNKSTNRVEILSIEKLYDKYIADPTRYLACTSDKNGKLQWSEISNVWRHKLNKGDTVSKVTIKHGSSVTVTNDHSLMLINDIGKLYSKPTREIAIGDKVAYARKITSPKVIGKEVISKEEIQLQEDRYVYDICVPRNETFVMANGIISHNSMYGILSQKTGIGYLPVGMTVTGMGRRSAMVVAAKLDEENSPLIIEDTDNNWGV